MRFIQTPAFAASLLFLPSLVKTNATDTSTFAGLLDALGDLGYDGKAATAFGGLDHLTTAIAPSTSGSCAKTCHFLGIILPNITSQIGSPSYIQQEAAYWSARQAETLPACRIQPKSALEVSASLLITKFFNCPFAVKSGGHGMFPGASNIQGGLTFDLANLNQVKVSQDKTLTQVGAGNHWVDVYSQLDKQQLSVVGGRVASTGVGGVTLGGGISFFSGRHGFACDNVRNYEVVLADASIRNVNYKSYPDLFFALRGGGNNFGIVTRFDLETFPQGLMWGGSLFYPSTANASLIRAFDNFAHNAPSDPDAAIIVDFVYLNSTFFGAMQMEYAKPIVNPPILHEFTAIESLASTMRITNLTDLVVEIEESNPYGFRELYITATAKPDDALMKEILDIFVSEVEVIKNVEGVLPALTIQPITKNIISHFSKNGGNALGISVSDGPLNLYQMNVRWSSASADDLIISTAASFIARSTAAAKAKGLDFRYIYQNYAAPGEKVFDGYGAANKARLIAISKKYDPERVFQKLQPGYFKLDGG